MISPLQRTQNPAAPTPARRFRPSVAQGTGRSACKDRTIRGKLSNGREKFPKNLRSIRPDSIRIKGVWWCGMISSGREVPEMAW
jgi:hypothetical protein